MDVEAGNDSEFVLVYVRSTDDEGDSSFPNDRVIDVGFSGVLSILRFPRNLEAVHSAKCHRT